MNAPQPVAWCAFCGHPRDRSEVLAFWPINAPDAVRWVCRPSLPRTVGESAGICFARLGPASAFVIATPERAA